MTSERADSFSDVQCIGLRFQPAAFSMLERRYNEHRPDKNCLRGFRPQKIGRVFMKHDVFLSFHDIVTALGTEEPKSKVAIYF